MAGRDRQTHSLALAVQGGKFDIPTSETTFSAIVKRKTLRVCVVRFASFSRLIVVVNKPNHFFVHPFLVDIINTSTHTKRDTPKRQKTEKKYIHT